MYDTSAAPMLLWHWHM